MKAIPKALRAATVERYASTCQDCKLESEPGPLFWMLCIHHLDGNHDNNDPDNLMLLCNGCHTRRHIRQGDCGFGFMKRDEVPS